VSRILHKFDCLIAIGSLHNEGGVLTVLLLKRVVVSWGGGSTLEHKLKHEVACSSTQKTGVPISFS
jgi:hypothetical protein